MAVDMIALELLGVSIGVQANRTVELTLNPGTPEAPIELLSSSIHCLASQKVS